MKEGKLLLTASVSGLVFLALEVTVIVNTQAELAMTLLVNPVPYYPLLGQT